MKTLVLGLFTACAISTASSADGMSTASSADGMYWVVGNRATNDCDIVTANPVIDGDIWFGDGPYRSLDDARLARSTIGACSNK